MKKLWRWISLLGVQSEETDLYSRTLILGNQLNAVLFMAMAIMSVFLAVMRNIQHGPISMGSIRLFLIMFLNLINLLLSGLNRAWFSKLSLIFISPVIFFILPTLMGFVEEESFAYYPYIIIAFSVLPPILFVPVREKLWYFISISYFGLLLFFIEPFLEAFMPRDFQIVSIIDSFYLYHKVTQVIVFVFLHTAIYQLRIINLRFEREITKKNDKLLEQNIALNKTLNDLDEVQKKLYRSERMTSLGSLTAGMAHEINNPLNYISGGIDLLEEVFSRDQVDTSQESYNEYTSAVQIVRKGVDKTKKIIDALMSFTAKEYTSLEPVDLSVLIDNCILFMRHTFPRNLRVRKDYGLKEPVMVYRDKLQQVILSILDNAVYAISFRKDTGEDFIEFKTYLDPKNSKYITLTITNSGPPIADDALPQIFDPFFTTKEPGTGTGLGLAIAYTFINDHKGTITAENTGNGVCFRIRFPELKTGG